MAELRPTGLPWATSVKEELARVTTARNDANSRGQRRSMFKVPPYIRMLKPDQYDHQLICFGLYSRDYMGLSRMDELRLEVVSDFLEESKLPGPDPWDSLCDEVAGAAGKAEALRFLYDDDHRTPSITPDLVRSVLTLDAVFLVALMSFWYFNYTSAGRMSNKGSRKIWRFWAIFDRIGVNCHIALLFSDMWLFENQIPLALIQRVWKLIYDDDADMEFNSFLKLIVFSAVETFTLGYSGEHSLDLAVSFEKCDHLFECLYKFVCSKNGPDATREASRFAEENSPPSDFDPSSRGVQISCHDSVNVTTNNNSQHAIRYSVRIPSMLRRMWTSLTAPLRWVKRSFLTKRKQLRTLPKKSHSYNMSNLLSVTELQKAGIRVKGVQTSISGMKFVKSAFYFRATLFLPRIDIDDNSERILRNLCAYELARESEHKIMCYLAVMDALIDTPDDVRLLRKGKEPVIALNYLGDDQDVALLFNNVLQKLSVKFSDEVRSLIKEVHDWYTSPLRHQITGYVSRFHDKPWLFISLIAANILFILTGLQTVYSMLSYYHPS